MWQGEKLPWEALQLLPARVPMILTPVVVTKEGKGHGTSQTSSVPLSSMHKRDHVTRARASDFFRSRLGIIWLVNVVCWVGCGCQLFLSPVQECFCNDFVKAELGNRNDVVRLMGRRALLNQISVTQFAALQWKAEIPYNSQGESWRSHQKTIDFFLILYKYCTENEIEEINLSTSLLSTP